MAQTMAQTKPQVYCKQCGLLTEYTDTRQARAEFGPTWPFGAGDDEVPGLESFPLAPVVVCACRIGKSVEERLVPCERFSPGC